MSGDLSRMLSAQQLMQRESFNADPTEMTTEQAIEFIHWNVTALVDELHEMLAEIGWKPWATSKHINGPNAAKEMIDAWHFFMNIMLALGPHIDARVPGTAEKLEPYPDSVPELAEWFIKSYFEKHEINRQRQKDGYDGVSTKCHVCKREKTEVDPNNTTCGQPEGCPFSG